MGVALGVALFVAAVPGDAPIAQGAGSPGRGDAAAAATSVAGGEAGRSTGGGVAAAAEGGRGARAGGGSAGPGVGATAGPGLAVPADPDGALPSVPPPPPQDARAAILVDAATGQVLYARNADAALPMASTTKIMTALLAIERGDLQQVITTGERAFGVEGSSLYLALGERRTLEELLYGLMLRSANDAAVAIAEGLAGSVDAFVGWMNQRARDLGLRHTRFADPHGLASRDHYTSARDLATLARVAMANPTFRRIVGTREYRMPWPEKQAERVLQNHNRFLWRYEGATGIKNGYTRAARGALVASARRDGIELIGVLLGAHPTGMYRDMADLMDWGFTRFRPVRLVRAGETVASVPVTGGRRDRVPAVAAYGSQWLVPRDEPAPPVDRAVQFEEPLRAPLAAGARVGTLVVRVGDQVVDRIPLLSGASVAAVPGWEAAGKRLDEWAEPALLAAGAILALVAGVRWRRHVVARRRWRRRVATFDPMWYAFRPRDPGAD
ncbi:MAG TPA: D-alanyl-D-alanine carboxypeptidase family protein [Thermaerobacter sp.]